MRKKLTIPQNKRNHLKGWEAMGMIQANGKKNRGRVKPTPVLYIFTPFSINPEGKRSLFPNVLFYEKCHLSLSPFTNRGVQMTKINPTSIYR